MKQCTRCKEFKESNEFYKATKKKDGLTPQCRKCFSLYYKQFKLENPELIKLRTKKSNDKSKKRIVLWAKNNPERVKAARLRYTFDISMKQYNEMKQIQNNACAICIRPETKRNGQSGKVIELCVDHDHDTGKIRALLCHDCNIAIGRLQDDFNIVYKAYEYLKKFK